MLQDNFQGKGGGGAKYVWVPFGLKKVLRTRIRLYPDIGFELVFSTSGTGMSPDPLIRCNISSILQLQSLLDLPSDVINHLLGEHVPYCYSNSSFSKTSLDPQGKPIRTETLLACFA